MLTLSINYDINVSVKGSDGEQCLYQHGNEKYSRNPYLSFILLFGKVEVPALLQHALRFVPIAVLSAIILPALLIHGNALYLSLHNTRLIAGVVATGVAWRTKNILLTIIAGMAVLWLLQLMVK